MTEKRPSRTSLGVYGPIDSRRLGRSLGVDFSPPGRRVCSFDCVYCEHGPPRELASSEWPAPIELGEALARGLRCAGPLDSITISGTGEPTLHPQFASAAEFVLAVARQTRPDVPVRILTNGSGCANRAVRFALDLLDERIVVVDADPERINRPDRRAPLGAVLFGLSLLRDVTVQSCFIEGPISNTGEETVREWAELVSEIRPRAVQIHTVSRQPAGPAWPVARPRLEEIAGILRSRTGIAAKVYASCLPTTGPGVPG